jgi:tetratricopeptide (TPR) repeat protein
MLRLRKLVRACAHAAVLAAVFCSLHCGPPANVKGPSLVADPPPTEDGRAPGAGLSDFDRGVAYIEKQAWEQALPHLDKALEADPKNAEAHYYRALASYQLGKIPEAEEDFKKALAITPSLVLARAQLGELYLAGDPPRAAEAIDVLEPAAGKTGDDKQLGADVHKLLAFAYRAQKQYDKSSASYQKSLQLDDSPAIHLEYADMLFEAERLDEAVEHLRKALPAYAKDKEHVAFIAHRFAKSKAWTDCVAAFDTAVQLDPKEPGFYLHRGLCKHELTQEDGAQADYEKAVTVDPAFQPGWYYLGMAYVSAKQTKKAGDAFEHAVKLDAASPVGQKAAEQLEKMSGKKKKKSK